MHVFVEEERLVPPRLGGRGRKQREEGIEGGSYFDEKMSVGA